MRRLRASVATTTALTVAACATTAPPTQPPPPATTASATTTPASPASSPPLRVGTRTLTPKTAIFAWRDRANDLTLFITDVDDPCAALSSGSLPRGATMLQATIKHTSSDNKDAPFSAGRFPLRHGSPLQPQDTKGAMFVSLDASCTPTARARATDGVIELTTPIVAIGGVADGRFDLTMESGEKLAGTFSARYCPPPENEPRGCR